MSGRPGSRRLLAGLCCLAACGHAPLDRRESLGGQAGGTRLKDVPVRGFPVEVETEHGEHSGELLAVDERYVYVLEHAGPPRGIRRSTIRRVTVEVRGSAAGETTAITALGAASTFSHGYFLVLTLPAWLAIGVPVSAGAAAGNDAVADGNALFNALKPYARYPQGLPRPAAEAPEAPSSPTPTPSTVPTPSATPEPPAGVEPPAPDFLPPLPGPPADTPADTAPQPVP